MHTQNDKLEDTEADFCWEFPRHQLYNLLFKNIFYYLLMFCCFHEIPGQQMNGVTGIFIEC